MRKKKGVAVLGIVLLIVIVIVGIAGFLMAKKYMPSREMADLQQYYEIEQEDEIPVILNQEIAETKGIQREGNVYFHLFSLAKITKSKSRS